MHKWLIPSYGRFDEKARLVCFPPAGGGWSMFSQWQNFLGPDVRVMAVNPAGRSAWFHEPPVRRLKSMVDAIEGEIIPLLDRPVAFFGHSFGALLAYELAHRLKARGGELSLLAVAARAAPHLDLETGSRYSSATDGELERLMRRLGGTAEIILNDGKLTALMIPALRADLEMNESFEYAERPALGCPIAAFYGMADPLVAPAQIEPWRRHTTNTFTLKSFPGGHFFPGENFQPFLGQLREELNRQ
jgi:medium-chain acyl-[acyl-carrier-protein] hydrolase